MTNPQKAHKSSDSAFARRMMTKRMLRCGGLTDPSKALHPWMLAGQDTERLARLLTSPARLSLLKLSGALGDACVRGGLELPSPACFWWKNKGGGRGHASAHRGVFTWDVWRECATCNGRGSVVVNDLALIGCATCSGSGRAEGVLDVRYRVSAIVANDGSQLHKVSLASRRASSPQNRWMSRRADKGLTGALRALSGHLRGGGS